MRAKKELMLHLWQRALGEKESGPRQSRASEFREEELVMVPNMAQSPGRAQSSEVPSE